LGKALIVAQIALSLILFHGAAVFLGTLRSLRAFDTGFEKEETLQVDLSPTPRGYEDVDMSTYRRQLIERLSALPGVTAVATSSLSLLAGVRGWNDTVSLPGDGPQPDGEFPVTLAVVSPEFFRTLGIPLVSGRGFSWTENEQHPPVVIIDSSLAGKLFPSGTAVGRRIRFGVQPPFQNLEIVGVAQNARLVDVRSDSSVIFVPSPQHPNMSQAGTLLVRTNRPGAVTQDIEKEIRAPGREYSTGAVTVAQTSERALRPERAIATLSSLFAAAALLLAGIGLFGLTSYAITGRTGEIGIRLALGSQPGGILKMILRETLVLAAAGIALGVPCALAAARLVDPMLFGLAPHDLTAISAVTGVLLTVAAAAGYLPARRAMKMDPLRALKHE
jgi:predicted permease